MRHLIIRKNLMHAFQGITVLDLSQGIAGPVCATAINTLIADGTAHQRKA